MIKMYKEITDWDFPNHTYLFDNDITLEKMIGYIKDGTTEVIMFSKPMKFFKSRRKFKITNLPKGYEV